ncbi:alpha/beta hydrolase [Cupriavidus pinatubonensis]|uniref:alpha/beta hydrolase n=1 Tax=Cupriavidus TaxID=106589 RepID=UPI0036114CE7
MNTTPQDIGPLQQDAASGLRYRLRDTDGVPAGRLLLLHGVGSNETGLAPLSSYIDPRVQIALVQGPLVFGPRQHGFFEVSFQSGAPAINAPQAERSRQQLITLVRSFHAQDAKAAAPRVPTVIAGFSQGGILSASVSLTAPQEVAGFAVLSGRILPEIEPHLAPREALAKLSALIAHGEFDDKLPVAWAERAKEWLIALGVPNQNRRYPIGHTLNQQVVSDFARWLAGPLALA